VIPGRTLAVLILFHSTCAVSSGGAAWPPGTRPEPPRPVVASAAVSVDQAVRMVEQRFHARVVKTQTQQDNGHTVYVMRLLNDSGKVWTVRVDAASGSLQ
jgi:uncharacterized membrane protein YkoI